MADGVPRYGANEGIPGVGVAGPRTRLLREEGVAVDRLIPRAGRHSGREDRQVHAVHAVQKFVEEVLVHPLRQPEGENSRLSQAGGPPVRRAQAKDGPCRVVQPGEPRPSGVAALRAVPQDVGLVLVHRALVRARGGGAHAVARNPVHRPHGSGQEPTQQRLLQLHGGCPQHRATSRAIRAVAQPPESDGAPRLQLARGVAA